MAASLAKQIRAAVDHEDHDLSGFNEAQVHQLMTAAFADPIPAAKPLGFRFTVGGGKKVRAKYGEDMPKWCREALRGIGFEEDRGASAVAECQGMFKMQHDLDKDLKFTHVFPRTCALPPPPVDESLDAEPAAADHDADAVIDPIGLCTSCTLKEFEILSNGNCPLYSQKKELLKRMKIVVAKVAAVEATLADRRTPDAASLALYDSAVQLQDKVQWLQQRMEAMISSGSALCKGELQQLQGELRAKLNEGQQVLDAATAAGKKTEKLQASLQAMQAQLDRVIASQPMKRQETAADAEMRGLRRQLKQLQALESSKGLLSGEQVKQLGGKRHLQERLTQMEIEARGWFYEQVPLSDRT